MKESHVRSIAKGVTWRITASVTTAVLLYLYTGNLLLTAKVSAVEVIIKVLFYYTHERLWGKVHWGMFGPEPRVRRRRQK